MNCRDRSSDLPVGNVAPLGFLPLPSQLGEAGAIQNCARRGVHPPPQIEEGSVPHTLPLLASLDEAQNLAHRNLIRGASQAITAIGAAPRFNEAGLLETGKYE